MAERGRLKCAAPVGAIKGGIQCLERSPAVNSWPATAAGAALATFKFPAPAIAQAAPFKLGLLTVKTGPLAQGGIQMEQGVVTWLKEKNNTIAGRKVEFFSADTGGNPAGTKTKVQELVERDKVDIILGPLAAFELLAITDYIAQSKIPLLSLAAAEDMTQRRPNPYFIRASATSAQAMHPMADYAAKEMKLKRVITISEDFAFGHEQMGGFQQTFEENGGKILKKIWPPLVTPDYTPYRRADRRLRRRLPGLRRLEPAALHEGVRQRRAEVPGGHRRNRRRRRVAQELSATKRSVSSAASRTRWISPTDGNKRFVNGMLKNYNTVPGQYAGLLYVNCDVVEAGLKALGGDVRATRPSWWRRCGRSI